MGMVVLDLKKLAHRCRALGLRFDGLKVRS